MYSPFNCFIFSPYIEANNIQFFNSFARNNVVLCHMCFGFHVLFQSNESHEKNTKIWPVRFDLLNVTFTWSPHFDDHCRNFEGEDNSLSFEGEDNSIS